MHRRLRHGYSATMLLLLVLYVAVPAAGLLVYAVIVTLTVSAIFYGAHRHRPRRRSSWWLLAGACAAFALNSVLALVLTEVYHDQTFPSLADVVSLTLTFPLLLSGLWRLSRSGAAFQDRASLIDALILTAGAGFLSWTFLVTPLIADADLTVLQKVVSAAYPMCDVLLLALLARLAFGAHRGWSVLLLLTSGAALLIADIMFSLSQLNGAWSLGGPIDVGWLVFLVAAGAAALHPSMVRLTEPRVLRPTEIKIRRSVLGVVALVAPAVLFIESFGGPVRNGTVISIGSAVLVMLALGRMSVVAVGLQHSMVRERELRRACETLLSATSVPAVETAVQTAVNALVRAGAPHRTALVLYGGGGQPDAAADTVSMPPVADLSPELRTRFEGFELALYCPLSVGDTRVGELFVAAHELTLVELQESARVIAGQAASMVEHIELNREINRRDAEAYFRTLVLNAADVILIVDADDRVSYASPSAGQLFGWTSVVGAVVGDLIRPAPPEESAPSDVATVQRCLVQRDDGSTAEVEVTSRDLRQEPTVAGIVLTLRDVTERRRLERELLQRAYTDPLTGLGSRLQFQDAVQAATTGPAAQHLVGVLLIDVDDFRFINDSMGHEVGDELLVAFGHRLAGAVSSRAIVARLGADEFGIVVQDAADVEQIEQIADRLLTACSEPFLVGGSVVTVRAAIGIATSADGSDGHHLSSRADVALAGAKQQSTSAWRRYEASMHARVLRRMQLRAELDQAIADEAFVLHFQPIVDLATGRPRGLEALVRWQHPIRGMVPPLDFIEIAEESGLIVPLGDWVMLHALQAAAAFRQLAPDDPPYISVNVSVRQFRAPGFVQQVFGHLARTGLPAELLAVEITESLLLGDDEQIRGDIELLRRAGVKINIDDFGTGFSSLSYLHRIPVDVLKLDKSFVDAIPDSQQQYDLVAGIIQLAHTLKLEVVAEGIETTQHARLLSDAGCGLGQGYLFARPLPQDEITGWLRQHRGAAASARPGVTAAEHP